MAQTTFATGNPLTVKLWAKKLFAETMKQTWFAKFMGTSSNSLIQVYDDASKEMGGDRVRVGLRMLLTGSGIQGDDTLEGNEEALTTYSTDVLINQLRHAVRTSGRLSQQRTAFDIREEAMQGLADWMAERIETWAANQLTGNTAVTDTRFTGNNACVAPSSAYQLFPTGSFTAPTAESSLSNTTNHAFNLQMLDRAVARARTFSPRIRPLRINGDEYYAAFLHPFQVFQLRTSTNTGQWLDIQKAAFAASNSAASSPIFTGALGIYNGVVLHECPYLPAFAAANDSTTNVRRAVFCGAQAAIMATGREGGSATKFNWVEELFDYGNQVGVSVGMMGGLVKTQFNSTDFATITLSTYSAQP